MKCSGLLLLLLLNCAAWGQRGLAFVRFSNDDGTGLASNVVSSLHQDEKGFIWVGTANGLQRFDGRKFIQISTRKPGSDPMPFARIDQILPVGPQGLLLAFTSLREFGLFHPRSFTYKKIALKTSRPIEPRAEFYLNKLSDGTILLNIGGYEMLRFDSSQLAFVPFTKISLPKGWKTGYASLYEDVQQQQIWVGCDSGIVIYDKASGQTWSRFNNPRRLPIFNHAALRERVSEIYIDRSRRIWINNWPISGPGGQVKYCFDSTGSRFLHNDTVGLNNRVPGYTEYRKFYESKDGTLWVYGLNILLNYDKSLQRFVLNKAEPGASNMVIDYEVVFQVMQDRDGSMWAATDKGLYFAAYGENEQSTVNLEFKSREISITDIMQMPNGDLWLACWGAGVKTISPDFTISESQVYSQPPPTTWPNNMRGTTRLLWTLCRQTSTGEVWMGCNMGILLIHDPEKKTTRYLQPPECNGSTIRFIAEDAKGRLWLGTQGGRLIKWENGIFTVVLELGTIIYKVFPDKEGWLWLATHEKGLYAIDPQTGKTIQHYTAQSAQHPIYSNTGQDIEQLNDSIMVFGAGALNFINKKTGAVRMLGYDKGLPSNTVMRLRMDSNGYLWIVTSNGLCRYNPANNRITPYGKKDGIMLAESTVSSDLRASNGNILFAGSNALIMFNPDNFLNNRPPPDVTITDFRLFNQYLPADSLLDQPQIKLNPDQNTFSIYFSSISYVQRDKMTYYYKMEGVDKEWIESDVSKLVSYSLLPPGRYTFKVYCETIEGIRSRNITEMSIFIKPPFWNTKWFYTTLLLLLAIGIYFIHRLRVNRLLAVEQLRNRVARDLHDDMGSTLSTINILSSMAKTKMSVDTVKTNEYLSKISDNSQRMMEAMDDIVWSIKPSNDSMQRVTARMREFATSVLEAKDIELDFSVQEEVYDVKLNMEARRDFFLVFKEAINNAAKYSRAEKVTVQVGLYRRNLELTVKDNGRGFNVQLADGGNGLGNMQKRADAMNGHVRLHSKEGQGTTVTITVPIH